MSTEPTIQDVLVALKGTESRLEKKISQLDIKIDGVQSGLEKKITGFRDGLEEKIEGVKTGLEKKIAGLKDKMENLQFHLEDKIAGVRSEMATKQDLSDVKHELLKHIDGLAQKHKHLDTEVVALRSRVQRVETVKP